MMLSTRVVRLALCAASLLVLGVAGITPAVATSGLASTFSVRYPSSTTRTAAGCNNTCQGGTTSTFNAYGRDLRLATGTNDQRLAAIESLDSDKEGNSNLVEITKNAQPGWCVATTPGCDNNGRTPPASLSPLDPPPASNQPPVASAGGGAPSQIDLFDQKPKLNELHGQKVPDSLVKNERFAFIKKDTAVMAGSVRKFSRHGNCGMELTDLIPHIGSCADDILLVRSMHTDAFNHHPAQLMLNSGVPRFGRPSMGAWLAYGLGRESENLPGYVVLTAGRGGSGGVSCGESSTPTLTNCIVWGNTPESDCGNLSDCLTDKNPMFVDPANGDYHLRPGSPAIDAGVFQVG